MPTGLTTVLMLMVSNVFMTFAWYGHLRFKEHPLWIVILVSWSIAFVEYCFAVPANRWGSAVFSTAQLKVIQEIVTLGVFAVFAWAYLGESLKWNHAVAFLLLILAAFFIFYDR